ncbi:hypothetical protein SAMN04487949_3606 [Halogranum gelatinilyticum]|uniref:Uncharacterized protein n=1 Tax=Halogranum gelatinilyticum TaxID=660521 RepID=A0A1G9ZCG9_9EURY|nr:hypothetical protein [Halogranum gelatinilyticum]SDN19092.1 hypothetical protein SAMN04487949_3606 [Halogranum gelatinilyticum]
MTEQLTAQCPCGETIHITDPDDGPEVEVDVVLFNRKFRFVPNVHAILSVSALVVMAMLIYTEMIHHGEANPLTLAEVAHFAGWVYLELPEAIFIETLE